MSCRLTFSELPKHWRCVEPPAAEPLHRTEAKSQCALFADQTDWDADFDRWIASARDYLEEIAEVALVTQTWELSLPRFPSGGEEIELYRPPVQAIESILYRDIAGEEQELTEYRSALTLMPAILVPSAGQSWPSTDCSPANVRIRFRTGFATPATVDLEQNTFSPIPQHFANGDSLRAIVSGGLLPAGLTARTKYFVLNADETTLQLATTANGTAIELTNAGSGQLLLGSMPDKALTALRLQVAHWFRNREAVMGMTTLPVVHAFDALAASLKWRS